MKYQLKIAQTSATAEVHSTLQMLTTSYARVVRSFLRPRHIFSALAVLGCMFGCTSVSAQDAAPGDQVEQSAEAGDMPENIGGGSGNVSSYYYTSPLKKLGSDMFVGGYMLNVFASLAYLAVVYPLQALFGSNKVEPVMLWMLVPIAGPWFAQYEDSVRSKPLWRVVLVADAALQASGLVLGLIGLALSGKRELHPKAADGVELQLGVQGAGLAGLTLTVHTL